MPRFELFWIDMLKLKRHPEGGGFFPQPLYPIASRGPVPLLRPFTNLLQSDDFCALHRLPSGEIWHFYGGAPRNIHPSSDNLRAVE